MFMRWMVLPMLLIAQPVLAGGYALLGPGFAAGQTDSAAAKATIARARAALSRPPGAIPVTHTEGTLPGKGIREVSIKARRDLPIMLDLAIAWRLTGDRAFLDQTGRYLDDWTRVYTISFNPIDETGFDKMSMAYDLTASDLPGDLRARVDSFWRRMATGYLDVLERGKTQANNWQSHRIKLATMAAFQTGDTALIARARAAYQKQIAGNLRPDGSTFDFEARDALHYVTYDLEPLSMAALSAKVHGQDWYGWAAPSGNSLRRSLDWLVPYATGAKTHIEFVHSTVKFDRDRAEAGQADFAPHPWQPEKSGDLFRIAALLDARYTPLARKLRKSSDSDPESWITLLEARR